MHQNTRLTKNKRKSEEQVLHFTAFKRRKLDKVGNSSQFETDRTRYETETGGLGAGFSDILTKQPMYTVTLS